MKEATETTARGHTFSRFDKHFGVLTNCFFRFDIPVSLFFINFAAFLKITKIIMI